jgi:hypothetical protein
MTERTETAQECAERMGVPFRHEDEPELWAMARVGWERIGFSWDELPYFLGNGDTDQLLRLVYAKGERDALRELGFDVVASPRTQVKSEEDS